MGLRQTDVTAGRDGGAGEREVVLSCALALRANQEQSLMSRTNEAEGEFQQVWGGWGVPVVFMVALGVFCGLSPKAVMGAVAGMVPAPGSVLGVPGFRGRA